MTALATTTSTTLPASLIEIVDKALHELHQLGSLSLTHTLNSESLLTERLELMGFSHSNQVSANGSCYLLEDKHGHWLALNLPRQDDWELLPALFQTPVVVGSLDSLKKQVQQLSASNLVEQGRILGLAICTLPDKPIKHILKNFYRVHSKGIPLNTKQNPVVVDLSSLWAGPLCSRLLACCGAQVSKVESIHRPDGARLNKQAGAEAFYNRLNHNKELICLDFKNSCDIKYLKQLIMEADIVIEGSRPRALKQLGIDADSIIKQSPKIWASITGYGRSEPQQNWIAFGDDAAISGGLYQTSNNTPDFIGDAIADPLTGIHAALAIYRQWKQGEGALLDINLHTIARYCAQG